LRCNSYAIASSKRCLKELARGGINEVAIYGANDIAEILYDLSFPTVIVALLVGLEDKVDRLRNLGIDEESIVF
jgi:hypothetical protein